jgi:phosphoribosylformylglycinamidine cyclo-ligase
MSLDTGAWELPALFQLLQASGDIADMEMRRVFNCGLGMLLVVPADQVDAALAAVPEALRVVGEITARDGAPVVFR